jgi:hypothetical protein
MERLFGALDVAPVEPDPQFIERLRRRVHDEATGEADSSIDTIDDYTEEAIVTALETDQSTQQPRPAYRVPLGIAAAVLLVVAVGAAVLLATRSDDSQDSAIQAQGVTVDSATEINNAYYAAYQTGDMDSVTALFTSDATFNVEFSGDLDRTAFELDLAWTLAQAGTLTSPECTVIDEVPGTAVTISCEYGIHDALGVAVGSPRIPTTTIMTITTGGISDFRESYGQPNFTAAGNPFLRWMNANHPEDAAAADWRAGDTIEESVARGELRAEYAKEWALYLEANDCIYNQGSC